MNVKLIGHTQLSFSFFENLIAIEDEPDWVFENYGSGSETKDILLTAIRTCYSKNKPTEILEKEGSKYFDNDEEGFKRLFERIFNKGHHSVLEHINFTFAVEGVSRSLLAQLTRHRHMSFSVQSQRYVAGGYDYVIPDSIKEREERCYHKDDYDLENPYTLAEVYNECLGYLDEVYRFFRLSGIPAEDARMILPNAATTNLVVTMNLRTLFEFYAKRQRSKGAQEEIAQLAEALKEEVVEAEPWLKEYFEKVKEVS